MPQDKKTTFVTSFGDNVYHTVNELEKQTDEQIVILKTNQCRVEFETTSKHTVLLFESFHILNWICSIYHLATSRIIFIDNYYGFLAVSKFKPNVICVQLWHAVGAIKLFGIEDRSFSNRSTRAKKRFQNVYNRFDKVVVSSEKMVDVFQKCFGLSDTKMLRTGVPRTDYFYQLSKMEQALNQLKKNYPLIHNKKVILYAPTFRDDLTDMSDIVLNIVLLYQELRHEYVLLLRLHPAVRGNIVNRYPDFIVNVSDYPDIQSLLVATDLLITDYSSIPFEFSMLGRPMIFFAYDMEKYKKTKGFWEEYEHLVPGPIARKTEDLIKIIRNGTFDFAKIQAFATVWNEYSNGKSSKSLIEWLYQKKY